jgi:hypothetical protein
VSSLSVAQSMCKDTCMDDPTREQNDKCHSPYVCVRTHMHGRPQTLEQNNKCPQSIKHVYKRTCTNDLKHLHQKQVSLSIKHVYKRTCTDDLKTLAPKTSVHEARVLKACVWTIKNTCTKKQSVQSTCTRSMCMDDKKHLYQKASAHETHVLKACVWTNQKTCT